MAVDPTLVAIVTKQAMTLGAVVSINVSSITQDPDDNFWVRRLMIFTDPLDAPNRTPVLDITMRSETKTSLEIEIPQGIDF